MTSTYFCRRFHHTLLVRPLLAFTSPCGTFFAACTYSTQTVRANTPVHQASNVPGHPSGSHHKMSSTPNVSPFAWASAVRNELQKVRGQASGGTGFEGWSNQGMSSDKWRQEKIRRDHLDYNALAREKLALQLLMRVCPPAHNCLYPQC